MSTLLLMVSALNVNEVPTSMEPVFVTVRAGRAEETY